LVTRRQACLAWFLAAASGPVRAQVAILESVAGSVQDGVWRLRFRTGPAARVRVARATLLLHIAAGAAPDFIDIVKPLKGRAETRLQRDGWITAQIPARCAQRLLDQEGFLEFKAAPSLAFHLPSQTGFAPYLVVEGK